MTIGKLARAAGVNVETVRYYQRIGLMPLPERRGGFRYYGQQELERLRFIKRAQRLGFSLKEIRGLLETDPGACAEVARQAERLKARIEREIEQLEAMRRNLEALLEACRRGELPCPLFQVLKGS